MDLSPAELAELQTIFKAECDEHLSALNGLLMSLERKPEDVETLNETFRRMHSVKGAARMVGLAGIEAVTHALEAMLSEVRDGKRRLGKPELELLFEGTDAVTDFMATMTGTKAEEPKVRALVARISGHRDGRQEGENGKAAAGNGATAAVDREGRPLHNEPDVPSAIEVAVESAAGGEMVRVAADKIDRL